MSDERDDEGSDTYVHEPGAVGGATDQSGREPGGEDTARQPRNTPTQAEPVEEFDWRGWVLVGAVVVAFLVVPGMLYVLPTVRGAVADLGLGLRHTYLVLPLVPALVLGAVAVWAAVRARAR